MGISPVGLLMKKGCKKKSSKGEKKGEGERQRGAEKKREKGRGSVLKAYGALMRGGRRRRDERRTQG